jgi:hypothetical protein
MTAKLRLQYCCPAWHSPETVMTVLLIRATPHGARQG